MKKQITTKIEDIVFGGEGIGTMEDGKKIFLWNALPGETVTATIQKEKKNYSKGIAVEILEPSAHRIAPKEESYLSTSPWQIMDSAYEQQLKQQLTKKVYTDIGNISIDVPPIIHDTTKEYGYRNKIEFSFIQDEKTKSIDLAFFHRGERTKFAVTGSLLADPKINETAQEILAWIRDKKIRIGSLKSLIVRTDHHETVAALFIKDELSFDDFPLCNDTFVGFKLYYSTHKSPASIPTKLLFQEGKPVLTAQIHDTKFEFGVLSFFQVNISLFETALEYMQEHIDTTLPILDMYAGVGSIGLALAKYVPNVICVENNKHAHKHAVKNIALNEISNAQAHCASSEAVSEYIETDQNLIVDPPRAGLHPAVIERILTVQPKRIIYMSCNISTQARDVALLEKKYSIESVQVFNFFPRTPHIESIVVLDKK